MVIKRGKHGNNGDQIKPFDYNTIIIILYYSRGGGRI